MAFSRWRHKRSSTVTEVSFDTGREKKNLKRPPRSIKAGSNVAVERRCRSPASPTNVKARSWLGRRSALGVRHRSAFCPRAFQEDDLILNARSSFASSACGYLYRYATLDYMLPVHYFLYASLCCFIYSECIYIHAASTFFSAVLNMDPTSTGPILVYVFSSCLRNY